MTVAELIAALSHLPQDALVVTKGFDECGYKDPSEPEEVRIAPVEPTMCCNYVDEGELGRYWKATGDVIAAVLID